MRAPRRPCVTSPPLYSRRDVRTSGDQSQRGTPAAQGGADTPTSLAAATTGANRLMNGAEREPFLLSALAASASRFPRLGTRLRQAEPCRPRPRLRRARQRFALAPAPQDLRHHPILVSHDRRAGDSLLQFPALGWDPGFSSPPALPRGKAPRRV